MCRRTSRNPWVGRSRLAMLVILAGLCSVPAIGQMSVRENLMIQGQVRTMGNVPLPLDVTVRLEEAEGQLVAQQFVGNDGKFRFDGLTGDTYRLIVTARGFQTATQVVEMGWLITHYPTIYLVPLVKKRSASSASPAETTTDLAAPKKARKEYEKGSAALESGDLESARNHLEKAVAEDLCYARAQTALGVTLNMQHQFAAAESAFNKSIKCDGAYLEAYLQLALLLKTQKKYKECEAALQQGLRRFPSEWRIHFQLGNAKDAAGDYETAEQEFLKAQSLNAELPPESHLRLAEVYLNWKKYDKAYAEMETYLRVDPNGRFAEPTRRKLREMEASRAVTTGNSGSDQTKP